MVKHPVSLEEYAFSRNITVEPPKAEVPKGGGSKDKTAEEKTAGTETSISLAQSNAVLKKPEDFKIGHTDQDTLM